MRGQLRAGAKFSGTARQPASRLPGRIFEKNGAVGSGAVGSGAARPRPRAPEPGGGSIELGLDMRRLQPAIGLGAGWAARYDGAMHSVAVVTIVSSFLASAVEFVEAGPVVLAG